MVRLQLRVDADALGRRRQRGRKSRRDHHHLRRERVPCCGCDFARVRAHVRHRDRAQWHPRRPRRRHRRLLRPRPVAGLPGRVRVSHGVLRRSRRPPPIPDRRPAGRVSDPRVLRGVGAAVVGHLLHRRQRLPQRQHQRQRPKLGMRPRRAVRRAAHRHARHCHVVAGAVGVHVLGDAGHGGHPGAGGHRKRGPGPLRARRHCLRRLLPHRAPAPPTPGRTRARRQRRATGRTPPAPAPAGKRHNRGALRTRRQQRVGRSGHGLRGTRRCITNAKPEF
mmetsp:Transcript_36407/g.73474  ORF Transcript_36407/g.73474 Transcript_36407/m.73474 type:complete len:278 (+) Transcript_36407:221-1054(+)